MNGVGWGSSFQVRKLQKFQCLQPKTQCGKFQAPSGVPEEGERSPGAKMLVPGFPDLGPPPTGRGKEVW